jgi:hypothetical protein
MEPIHMIPTACHHEEASIPRMQLPQHSMKDQTGSQRDISIEQQSGCKLKSVCDMSDLLQVLDSIVPSNRGHQHLQINAVTRESEQAAVNVTPQISANEATSTKPSCSKKEMDDELESQLTQDLQLEIDEIFAGVQEEVELLVAMAS